MDTSKHRRRARPDVEPRRFGFCTGPTADTNGTPAPKTARPGRATFATFPAREDAAGSSREPGRKGQTHRPAQRGASDLHSDVGRHDDSKVSGAAGQWTSERRWQIFHGNAAWEFSSGSIAGRCGRRKRAKSFSKCFMTWA